MGQPNPDHPAHPGSCNIRRPDCLLSYIANGDVQRDPDYQYRVAHTGRDVTEQVLSLAEQKEPLLRLKYDGEISLTAAGERRVAANQRAERDRPDESGPAPQSSGRAVPAVQFQPAAA